MLAILLSTYNGEQYLAEQLESIINQTYHDFTLYVADDGSTDRTVEIVRQFERQDKRIVLLEKPIKHAGAYKSFMWLLQQVEADFYMFADHDDFWLPEKVETELAAAENCPKNKPVLVHCDLTVTDENLKTKYQSFWKFNKYKKNDFSSFKFHCAYNNIAGCTMLINKVARDLCLPAPATAKLHDAWVALAVSFYKGIFVDIETPLIKYRQHSKNIVGAKKSRSWYQKIRNIKLIVYENLQLYKTVKVLKKISIIKFLLNKTTIYLKVITIK
ncbi:MAG: glycosyltransferase family 2 protein [Prevotellaceae bacterium]|jgi:glycosyltransferase involved in cell wall biosynthesis|nr:glycosyltransferase family 2 protein [Prevotellaceae bacterium]